MAQRESGYERIERDAYMTPPWPTHALTHEIMGPRFRRGMIVWEPAAGTLQMVGALESVGLEVIPSDIHAPTDRPELFGGNRIMVGDFLDDQRPFLPFEFDAIITNPPYDQAEKFVRKALELTKPKRGIVAMLLGVKFDSAVTRSDIFNEHPAWGMKITLLDRIWWFDPRADANGKVNSPSEDHAWFVWDWRGTLGRTMRYARAPEEVRAELKTKIAAAKQGFARQVRDAVLDTADRIAAKGGR